MYYLYHIPYACLYDFKAFRLNNTFYIIAIQSGVHGTTALFLT